MERIKSFTINHNILKPGFYISRKDGEIVTYDLRTRKPNAGDYMSNSAMHSVEHMFATCVRNSEIADDVVYFGPMGCQTGFYLVVRDVGPGKVFEITKEVLKQILEYDGPVFGASAIECGHYCIHNSILLYLSDSVYRCIRSISAGTVNHYNLQQFF